MNPAGIATQLFELSTDIRYVAVNQDRLVEMARNPKWPGRNPTETDRPEELIVNPIVLDLTRRRGEVPVAVGVSRPLPARPPPGLEARSNFA